MQQGWQQMVNSRVFDSCYRVNKCGNASDSVSDIVFANCDRKSEQEQMVSCFKLANSKYDLLNTSKKTLFALFQTNIYVTACLVESNPVKLSLAQAFKGPFSLHAFDAWGCRRSMHCRTNRKSSNVTHLTCLPQLHASNACRVNEP